MKYLFVFLLIIFVSVYFIKPNKNNISVLSVLITILMLICCAFLNMALRSGFEAGQEIAKSVIPAIIAGVVFFFMLKTKVANKNYSQYLFVLFSAILISLTISVYQYRLEKKIDNDYKSISTNNDLLNKEEIFNKIEFKNISFNCYSDWKVDRENNEEETVYAIHCERNILKSYNYFGIVFYENQLKPPKDAILNILEGLSNEYKIDKTYYNQIEDSVFNGYNCKYLDLCYQNNSRSHYVKMFCFRHKPNTIIVIMETNNENDLDSKFKVFEGSFEIKNYLNP